MDRFTTFLFRTGLIFLLFCIFTTRLNAQSAYWQQQVNYNIQVQLDDQKNTMDGFEKMVYFNNSPDTLTYIWFHVWMNAYKNDKTAFSDQKLINGSTNFYFSDDDMKGYTGKLSFRVNNEKVTAETHPKYIDIIKVNLKYPLPPRQSIEITTPFHVKLPYNFSRGGHVGNDYQITQWYPKPAVYDARGWHPMPYLDQGEFYSEFGNYHVEITLPEKYIVASSGVLDNPVLLDSIKALGKTDPSKQIHFNQPVVSVKHATATVTKQAIGHRGKKVVVTTPVVITEEKVVPVNYRTWVYNLNKVHDFAWFASSNFTVQYDTLQLPSKTIDVFTYYPPNKVRNWDKSVAFAKDGMRKYSQWLGDYPYSTASVVCGAANVPSGGMEYPSITLITTDDGGKSLDEVIAHELGHNWFYGSLASNERDHAWMDEGMNTYYQKRYTDNKYKNYSLYGKTSNSYFHKRITEDIESLLFETEAGLKKDQPIELTSDSFTEINYGLIVYEKTALWMKRLAAYTGEAKFDSAMHAYYSQWREKHPYPEDFKHCFETASNTNIDSLFHQLSQQGSLEPVTEKKKLKFTTLFSLKDTKKYHYISFTPVAGYNFYDKFMPGIGIHNYQLPLSKVQFYAAGMYSAASKQIHGVARVSYNIYKKQNNYQFAISYADFNMNKQPEYIDGTHYYAANESSYFTKVTKVVPSFHWTIFNKDARSTERLNIYLRTFLIDEEQHNFNTIDSVTQGLSKNNQSYYVNQLKIAWSDYRKLYPYDLTLQIDQGKEFVRAGLTGHYFFNYPNEKQEGINARFFAGKFFYTVPKTYQSQYETDRYHLNLTGADGNEDYTYSDYFIARNKMDKWQGQQLMERDGFFKMRTDFLSSKVGKTDDWLIAFNLEGKVPNNINPLQILPFKIPLHFFLDVGTYADVWKDNNGSTQRFLYDAGLYLPIMKGAVKIYIPIMYSNVFKDYVNSVLNGNYSSNNDMFDKITINGKSLRTRLGNTFLQTVQFSFNLDLLKPQRLSGQIPL